MGPMRTHDLDPSSPMHAFASIFMTPPPGPQAHNNLPVDFSDEMSESVDWQTKREKFSKSNQP